MSERFFASEPISDSLVTLEGPEAHHLARVMRGKVGDQVTLFDGSDAEFRARVTQIKRSTVVLEICERRNVSRESANKLVLGVALPRSDRQRWLVEKAVELGVAEIIPLITTRGVAQPGERARQRLERTVIEASKQCCRNTLLRIAEPLELEDYLTLDAPNSVRWIAHPGSHESRPFDPTVFSRRATSFEARVAIGPEGGFTDGEIAMALKHHWQIVDLGPRVLRIETAALAIASLVLTGT